MSQAALSRGRSLHLGMKFASIFYAYACHWPLVVCWAGSSSSSLPWDRFWFSVRDHVIPAAEGERRATQGERLFRASLSDSMYFSESGTVFWRLRVNPLVCHAWRCCASFWTVCGRHERALQPLPGTQTRAALSLRIWVAAGHNAF